MKVDCSICFTYKYISSAKVRDKYCCKFCREHNGVYYRPDLLDVRKFLGYELKTKENLNEN